MKKPYESPIVESIDIKIEKGFANSNIESPEDGGEFDW